MEKLSLVEVFGADAFIRSVINISSRFLNIFILPILILDSVCARYAVTKAIHFTVFMVRFYKVRESRGNNLAK